MKTKEGITFVSWPMALPHKLAQQMMLTGFREHLGFASPEYWDLIELHFGVSKPPAKDAIGLQLWGDEGQIFENEQYMVFQWSSENSPWFRDSKRSRWLICLLPVSQYAFHEKENVTVQTVMKEIVRSLNYWRENPIQGLAAQCVSVKGDWKYISQILLLKRKPDTDSCCFLCMGTKGLQVPITDLSADASWRRLVPLPPWHREPAILELHDFTLGIVGLDIMHIFFLGCGRDLVASVLVILLRSGHFHGPTAKYSDLRPDLEDS